MVLILCLTHGRFWKSVEMLIHTCIMLKLHPKFQVIPISAHAWLPSFRERKICRDVQTYGRTAVKLDTPDASSKNEVFGLTNINKINNSFSIFSINVYNFHRISLNVYKRSFFIFVVKIFIILCNFKTI